MPASIVTPEHASGGTDGAFTQITATGSPGTTIHTASATSGVTDEVWAWATNTSTSDVTVTVEWGGTGVANEQDEIVPANSTIRLIPGWRLSNSKVVAVYASTGSVVNVKCQVNRHAPNN